MKICRNCNSQFDDNTIFCSTCGSRLDEQQFAQPQYSQPQYTQPQYAQPQPQYAPPAPKSNEPNKATVILGFIGKIASIISAFFALCAIATPYIRVSTSIYSSSIYATFRPEEVCSVISFLFALAALALVTVSAIMVFTKRPKLEMLFSKISGIALSFFLLIFTIVLMANM